MFSILLFNDYFFTIDNVQPFSRLSDALTVEVVDIASNIRHLTLYIVDARCLAVDDEIEDRC